MKRPLRWTCRKGLGELEEMVLRSLEKLPGDVDLASEVSGSLLLPKLSLYNISKA